MAWISDGAGEARYQSRVVARASVERGRLIAEGGAELAVVDDPRLGELVEGVQVLAHRRLDQAEQPQGGPTGGEQPRPVTGEPVDVVDDLAGGPGLGDRQVPDLAGGLGRRCRG